MREPTKAQYEAFDDDPYEEFTYFLAAKLHRTVAELLEGGPGHRPLSALELLGWDLYYQRKAQREELEYKMAQGRQQ